MQFQIHSMSILNFNMVNNEVRQRIRAINCGKLGLHTSSLMIEGNACSSVFVNPCAKSFFKIKEQYNLSEPANPNGLFIRLHHRYKLAIILVS